MCAHNVRIVIFVVMYGTVQCCAVLYLGARVCDYGLWVYRQRPTIIHSELMQVTHTHAEKEERYELMLA